MRATGSAVWAETVRVNPSAIDATTAATVRRTSMPNTIVYRLEEKGALQCVKRISNAKIFEAVVTREHAQQSILNDLMYLFRGRSSMVMAHMIESGELTMDDIKDAEKTVRKHLKESKKKDPA